MVYDEYGYPNGQRMYEVREIDMLDLLYPDGDERRTRSFVKGTDNLDEIGGALEVVASPVDHFRQGPLNPRAASNILLLVASPNNSVQGTILYDGACGFCSRWVGFWGPTLRRHGFQVAALQEPWVAERLGMDPSQLLADIRLLTPDGTTGFGRKCISACCSAHLVDDAVLGHLQSARLEPSASPWISLVRAQSLLCFGCVPIRAAAIVSSLPLTASFLYTLGLPQA